MTPAIMVNTSARTMRPERVCVALDEDGHVMLWDDARLCWTINHGIPEQAREKIKSRLWRHLPDQRQVSYKGAR